MRIGTTQAALAPLFITYLLVKVVHHLAGFKYDLVEEGVLNAKFAIDLASWGVVYAVTYFLLSKLAPQKSAPVR
ncbi:hypothetical protein FJM65_04315 [Pontibacter mangrovi]|uniref:Uncharacterized protein n=1 Tax=Pontibacter mangrovi TaxID=2589816 RepID=A0A501WA96_9BACT|nr:hypothetical protein FJM65_04315 [Pontibacter mangrovi]